ncbi:protein MAIN-LIKE 1-like [Mercurialis annua]|uniref:protein MAIN-LIKE 1-like n=1 Tax=Mercurialis annua TaxID=3986 RepID=UPI0021606400|nr:protein MAIN-LIKE 1-like [Mercurialis annua]
MERWMDTTHTFHLLVGELTVTPLDFSLITGISFGGASVPFDGGLGFYPQRDAYIFEMLGFIPEMKGLSIRHPELYDRYKESFPLTSDEVDLIARSFICYLLGSTLFCSSGATLPLCVLPALEDLDVVSSYDWGSSVLAYLYTSMDRVVRGGSCLSGIWPAVHMGLLIGFGVFPRLGYPMLRFWDFSRTLTQNQGAECRGWLNELAWTDVDASWNTPPGVRLSRWVQGAVARSGMCYMMHGPSCRSWFLGERVLHWWGGPRVRMVPVGPPSSMLRGRDVVSPALGLDLRGYPATDLISVPQLSYLDDFARHRLLKRLPLDGVPVI